MTSLVDSLGLYTLELSLPYRISFVLDSGGLSFRHANSFVLDSGGATTAANLSHS